MIFTRDFVTRENYWQIASLMTQKSLFTVTCIILYIYHFLKHFQAAPLQLRLFSLLRGICIQHFAGNTLNLLFELIQAGWRIYASVNKAIIDSDDELSIAQHQANTFEPVLANCHPDH